MKFTLQDSKTNQITKDIQVSEYCDATLNLPIDAAIANINGTLGPKLNKTFSELFFILSGHLEIEADGVNHVLSARDVFIVKPGIRHTVKGIECEALICCTPQFKLSEVEF